MDTLPDLITDKIPSILPAEEVEPPITLPKLRPIGDEIVDERDYKTLLFAIMTQSIDDYIKLQHPASRVKKYLQEIYLTAIGFLFDPEFRMESLINSKGLHMSTSELIREILDSDRDEQPKLQTYTIQQTRAYWDANTKMKVFDTIPDTICIEGETFSVEHAEIRRFTVDPEDRIITLNKTLNQDNQINFLEATLYTMAIIHNDAIRTKDIKRHARELYNLLKVNNCFTAVVPLQSHTPADETSRAEIVLPTPK